jgi:hypothetical protein
LDTWLSARGSQVLFFGDFPRAVKYGHSSLHQVPSALSSLQIKDTL